jgi:hypothetical protein
LEVAELAEVLLLVEAGRMKKHSPRRAIEGPSCLEADSQGCPLLRRRMAG